ncbi:MAG: ankyrin repeat domain-containing protein, partial [Planctomycetota bacterium]
VKLLLDNGADVDLIYDGEGSFSNCTALHLASYSGHDEVAETLLSNGAQVDARNGWLSDTPLRMAARRGHPDIARILIKYGANVNMQSYDQTPLDLARAHGHGEIVKLLKAAGGKSSNELERQK